MAGRSRRRRVRRGRRTSRRGPRRVARRSSRKRGSRVTQAAIVKSLMPKMTVRNVVTYQVTTGKILHSGNNTPVGNASTGRYGLFERRYLSAEDLTALKARYNEEVVPAVLQSIRTGAKSFSRYRCATKCHSRVANTTGTTVVVEFMRFRTLRQINQQATWPVQDAVSVTPQPSGGPLLLAQSLMFQQGGVASTAPTVDDLDIDFWKTPLFKAFFKLVGHSAVQLAHGQSTEFKWSLPTVSWSDLELYQWDQSSANASSIPNRTYFTVWRIRGALGAINETANIAATTAISTVLVATTRTFTVSGSPIYGNINTRTIDLATDLGDGAWPASTTQVWVNNEYGQGTVVQTDNTN